MIEPRSTRDLVSDATRLLADTMTTTTTVL
jgi:hypothetical protein